MDKSAYLVFLEWWTKPQPVTVMTHWSGSPT